MENTSRAQGRTVIHALAACVVVFSPHLARAADAAGIVWIGGGAGGVECPSFVSVMERARAAGLGTVEYVSQTQGFMNYVVGFQTGYNMQTPNTCDIFAHVSSDQVLAWAENWCRANPLLKFGGGMIALAKERYKYRSVVCR